MNKFSFKWDFLGLSLVLALAAFTFAACSNDDDDEDGGEDSGAWYQSLGTLYVAEGDYTQDSVKVALFKNGEAGKVAVHFYNVRFSSHMPVYLNDMVIDGVTSATTSAGHTLTGDSIIPTTGGSPYATYMVTNLHGTVTDKELTLDLKFGSYHTTYQGDLLLGDK